ncbi:MAG: protein tyrosine phosphatase [Legionella sp.]|nr:protein tyrosine phosphatase [Legionella sp.]
MFVKVANTPVKILYYRGQGKTFIHVHQNEKTALAAAKAVINKEGGSLITLVHDGGRNIVFRIKKSRYEFDPNRIFTKVGIKKTLTQYSHFSPEAYKEVNKLALKLKSIIPKGKLIAVHNNATYSLKDYLPGHELAREAAAMHLNSKEYFRNFFLLTKSKDFKRLKSEGFNGVLQKPSPVDDGSLSVLFAKNTYINVEAGYGHLIEQINMLKHA